MGGNALFGRYEYAGELGRGATGRVFAALDRAEGSMRRALKVVSPAHAAHLIWEFSRLARVNHPRVAGVRELLRVTAPVGAPFGLAPGSLVLVEDYVEGERAGAVLKRAADPDELLRTLLRIAIGVAEALSAIHDAGLVHGDVKPENILCAPDGSQATLVDLGFARPPASAAVPRGTPRFMAPELFAGVCTRAADVYALGALLFDAISGELGERVSSGSNVPWQRRDLAQLGGRAAASGGKVIAELLHPDHTRRPPDGRAALATLLGWAEQAGLAVERGLFRDLTVEVSLTPDERAQRARSLPFVGRAELLETLVSALEQAGLVLVRGLSGSGRSRLTREAIRLVQERRAGRGARVPTWVSSLPALEQVRDTDAIVWLERADAELIERSLRAIDAFQVRGQLLVAMVECGPELAVEGARCIDVEALSARDFAALFDALCAPHPPSPGVRQALEEASRGLAGRLCELVALAATEGRDLSDVRGLRGLAAQAGELGLSPRALRLAGWMAWSGGVLPERELVGRIMGSEQDAVLAFEELSRRGALTDAERGCVLASETARQVRKVTRAERTQLLAELARHTPHTGSGFACVAEADYPGASAAFAREARGLVASGELDAAQDLLREALEWTDTPDLRLLLAEVERARARYREALAQLDGLDSAAACWLRAEVARLSGDARLARDALALLDGAEAGPWKARGHALRARLCFDAGDLAQAERELQGTQGSGDLEAELRGQEVGLLLALARGEPAQAQAERLVSGALRLGAPRAIARALALRAHVSQREGTRARALADLREAVRRAQAAGETHETATYTLNLGLCELDGGELGPALETLRDAAYRLAWIGRASDVARVLFNIGSAALLVGDGSRAEAVLGEARRRLVTLHDPAASGLVAVALAELALQRGAVEAACSELETALAALPEHAAGVRAIVAARAGLAQVAADAIPRAAELAALAARLCPAADVSATLEVAVLEIRLALAAGDPERAEAVAARALPRAGLDAAFPERLRLVLATIDAARALSAEDRARERTALGRAWLEQALASLPAALRSKMRDVPAYARVLSASGAQPEPTPETHAERWRSLVRAGRRLFAEQRSLRVAQRLVEIALELVHAERALVVVGGAEDGPHVLANAELSRERGRAASFSRSVVEQVWLEAKPLVTVEARADARLDSAQSVHQLSVRSVLALPLEGFHERAVLYLDDRMRAGAFGPGDVALMSDLAELARQALRAGEALRSQARRARRAERESEKLGRALERAVEQQPLPSPFVGTSAPLRRVMDVARRVAAADAPVLITGESGTGKELLARFVHDESPRRAAAFVAESCAALPDSLLESALFGHVRGAFTGAERARKGLFEIADGGTLFLDEVGEMSPSLQSKLLRVLQEHEFRPLGSERTRQVDVRVIAATRRDLFGMVREGLFREDLYYRVAVITLELPPLAERREDIPLLVAHFVAKYAPGRVVRVSPAAMRMFEARAYPGNVRQLENEVRRALALCEAEIEPAHLEPQTSAQAAPAASGGEGDLDLHAQTDRLTRRLVEQALSRANGNVTAAAQLLGVSRFGLQKILKRLALPPAQGQRK